MKKNVQLLLRFGSLFMVAEALYHFSGVRLSGAAAFWPENALAFIYFFQVLWGSASVFIAMFLWMIATDVTKYKAFLKPLAVLMIFHSCILYFFASQNLTATLPAPALYLWNPHYNLQLIVEGLVLTTGGVWLLYFFL